MTGSNRKPAHRPELRIRIEAGSDLFDRLAAAARERLVTPQLLAIRAIDWYLKDLIPIAELPLTYTERDGGGGETERRPAGEGNAS